MATCKTMRRRFCEATLTFAIVAVVVLSCAPAHAELVAADAANAMPGWYGTEIVEFVEDVPANFVSGSIDYAVYAPGNFNLSFPGQDPSGGSHYVYRYQIHNDAALSSDYIWKLTVRLSGVTNAANCTWIEPGVNYPGTSIAPSARYKLVGKVPTSAIWEYLETDAIDPGEDSKILLFTSPFSPTLQRATLVSQSTVNRYVDETGMQYNWWEGQLPSPVPEPASLLSLLVCAGLFSVYRALRRK